MSIKHNVKLIDGVFEYNNARLVLLNLINSKIQYHSIQNFSRMERYGVDTSGSEKRLEELRAERDALQTLFSKVELSNPKIKLSGNIEVEIEVEELITASVTE